MVPRWLIAVGQDALLGIGYQSEGELVRDIRDLERKVKAARLRAGEVDEEVSLARARARALSPLDTSKK